MKVFLRAGLAAASTHRSKLPLPLAPSGLSELKMRISTSSRFGDSRG